MTGEVPSLERARTELSSGAWSRARASFEHALADDASPEALFGLAVASWWLGDTEAALSGWERAYTTAVERDDLPQAVFSAVYLCLGYEMSLGNEAIATGWVDRADELVARFELMPFVGWVLLCRAHLANDHGRPASAEAWAREAVALARAAGDVDLELCATGELGTAFVESGRFGEGLSLLGGAMARALAGEAKDLDAVVLIGCRIVTSCSRASDPKRALQWVRAADDFNERYGSVHLFTTCRAHYGAVLVRTGAWDDAERELLAALEIGRRAEPALHAEATAKLAELRLAQGRIDDAERLLRGLESQATATLAVAALRLARGEAPAAASLILRRLRRLPEDCLEGASLTELLIEADIARGALTDAVDRAAMLLERGIRAGCDPIVARASRCSVGRSFRPAIRARRGTISNTRSGSSTTSAWPSTEHAHVCSSRARWPAPSRTRRWLKLGPRCTVSRRWARLGTPTKRPRSSDRSVRGRHAGARARAGCSPGESGRSCRSLQKVSATRRSPTASSSRARPSSTTSEACSRSSA